MTNPVLRWEVPIDDQDHLITYRGNITGEINFVAKLGTKLAYLEFWTWDPETNWDPAPEEDHLFRVFGTGQDIPEHYELIGTSNRVGTLVFHLFERVA